MGNKLKNDQVKLCTELHPYSEKPATRFHLPIPVDEQLAVTIWRLTTNVEYWTISALFGIGISTVCETIHKTCQVVTQHLLPKYVRVPPEERLMDVIDDFENLWGFPQVVGAIDGSHIPILKPIECPSDYYNRKGFFSVLL